MATLPAVFDFNIGPRAQHHVDHRALFMRAKPVDFQKTADPPDKGSQ